MGNGNEPPVLARHKRAIGHACVVERKGSLPKLAVTVRNICIHSVICPRKTRTGPLGGEQPAPGLASQPRVYAISSSLSSTQARRRTPGHRACRFQER